MATSNEMIRPVILSRPAKTAVGCLILSAKPGVPAQAAIEHPRTTALSQLRAIIAKNRARRINVPRASSRGSRLPAKPGEMKARSAARRPGLIVAARGLSVASMHDRTLRAQRARRSRGIAVMRQFPFARAIVLVCGRRIDRLMKPAIPAGRRHRGLGNAVIDHPATLEAERRIDLAAAGAVIPVAELVFADEFAVPMGMEQCVEGRPVPPSEVSEQEQFQVHRGPGRHKRNRRLERARTMARAARPVQRQTGAPLTSAEP